jgi:hypothetical protein
MRLWSLGLLTATLHQYGPQSLRVIVLIPQLGLQEAGFHVLIACMARISVQPDQAVSDGPAAEKTDQRLNQMVRSDLQGIYVLPQSGSLTAKIPLGHDP